MKCLGPQLSASGISVMHTDGDEDLDIVSSFLTVQKTCSVTLLGEDTDLLILLPWHSNPSDIKKSKQLPDDEVTHSILAIHVFCGCDTTSRLHPVESRTVL